MDENTDANQEGVEKQEIEALKHELKEIEEKKEKQVVAPPVSTAETETAPITTKESSGEDFSFRSVNQSRGEKNKLGAFLWGGITLLLLSLLAALAYYLGRR